MKGNKGITLIALVITIIVLLILAGVSIAMLSGDNSILGRAKSTVVENELAEARDQVGLAWNAAYSDYLEAFYADNKTVKKFSDYLTTRFGAAGEGIANATKFTAAFTPGSGSNKGKITITSSSDKNSKLEAEVTDTTTAGSSNNPATVGTASLGEWKKPSGT